MSRRLSNAVVVGALAIAAVACSSSSTPSGRSTSTSLPPHLEAGDTYVALGSSIASGFGISHQSATCGRSDRNYPHLVAAHYKLKLIDVTCGGAVIPNVLDTPQGESPPQLDAITADTKLITITVGGNDIGYNATALGCGNPDTVCTAPATLDADVAKTREALRAMLQRIKEAAPSATIVFVTYPREVPAAINCPELSFTDSEVAVIRMMGEELEGVFRSIAKDMDLTFVDPYSARGDHTGCAPASERWTAGHVADDGFAYHPTALGHQVMAQMIIKALGGS